MLIPTYLVTILLLLFFLSFHINEKQESNFKEVVGLVAKSIFVQFTPHLHHILHKQVSYISQFMKKPHKITKG